MKLKKIYFDSFKSLTNKEFEINHECIGLVGINESGKSNILSAINVLNGDRVLSLSDTPKMDKTHPSLRFQFELNDAEKKELSTLVSEWRKQNTIYSKDFIKTSSTITYNITYNKNEEEEERWFVIDEISLESDCYILLDEKLDDIFRVKNSEFFFHLSKAIIIKESTITLNSKHLEYCKEWENLSKKITQEEENLKSLKAKLLLPEFGENDNEIKQNHENLENDNLAVEVIEKKTDPAIEKIEKNIEVLNNKKSELQVKINDFNIVDIINSTKEEISALETEIDKIKYEIEAAESQYTVLNKPDLEEEQKKELIKIASNRDLLQKKQKKVVNKKLQLENKIHSLEEPFKNKYTKDIKEIHLHLNGIIEETLQNFLPKVVYWEHDAKYILNSETLFKDLVNKEELDDISRPLVNIFRIGLSIKTISELKEKVSEIQTDGSERSRYAETINKKINEYLKKVWPDYDQNLKISLERDQIRIQIFDPNNKSASFYDMEERSQGCKTFLSFLLTIGVEAEHNVIRNTILLLDEPETHLHPSGVRFMLNELIKISQKNNLVIYATHSIFLIDRNKFDRHVIVKKEKENTILTPSNVGRIGYFMQEEVLYDTLDFNSDKDFKSSNEHNFVFEGDGDATVFEFFYDKILQDNRPFQLKSTSFHQGGKCSDIKKYFSSRPIQLGSKWIFILDKDSPAEELKHFLEGKYKKYIDSEIYIFQYYNKNKKSKEIELEDLFPSQFIINIYAETARQLGLKMDEAELKKFILDDTTYVTYNEIIFTKYLSGEEKEQFKGRFKEVFNNEIKKLCISTKTEENFKKSLPEYYQWVTEIIEVLRPKKVNLKKEGV